MKNSSRLDDVFVVNSNIDTRLALDALNAALCKLETLSYIGSMINVDVFQENVINNYFWTMMDLTENAKSLLNILANNAHT